MGLGLRVFEGLVDDESVVGAGEVGLVVERFRRLGS
jgi:hypothetical protein